MALKIFLIKLKNKEVQLSNQRKVEHLFIKHSGIKLTLRDSIRIISSVVEGNEVEVLLNSDKLETIQAAFEKYEVEIIPKPPKAE